MSRKPKAFGPIAYTEPHVLGVMGNGQRISVRFCPKYTIAMEYMPQALVCFEQVTVITDAFNLVHVGLYHSLQASRWVRTGLKVFGAAKRVWNPARLVEFEWSPR